MFKDVASKEIDKHKAQIFAVRVSLLSSILLFLISFIIGITVDSVTLLLDAGASLVILAVGFLMHFSLNKIRQPPDDLYNFGYGKYEPLTIAIQNILIMVTCVVSIKFSIQDIIHPEDIHNYLIPVIATFISGLIGIGVIFYLQYMAKRTDSMMLKTAGLHWQTDTMLSFGMCVGFLIGLILHFLGLKRFTDYVDPVMAIILATILIYTPIRTIKHSLYELLDAVPAKEIHNKVKMIVDQYRPKSFGVHRLRSRKAGEKVFIDVCFIVKRNLTVNEIEEMAYSFQQDLRKHIPTSDVVVSFKGSE